VVGPACRPSPIIILDTKALGRQSPIKSSDGSYMRLFS